MVGLLALTLAGVYYYFAGGISHSMLSDQVGADGLPKLYAVALGLLGAFLMARSLLFRTASAENIVFSPRDILPHLRALGLLGLGVGYLLLISNLGYLLTIFLLLITVTVYCGAQFNFRLFFTSAVGSAIFWLVFVKMFSMPLPTGALWQ